MMSHTSEGGVLDLNMNVRDTRVHIQKEQNTYLERKPYNRGSINVTDIWSKRRRVKGRNRGRGRSRVNEGTRIWESTRHTRKKAAADFQATKQLHVSPTSTIKSIDNIVEPQVLSTISSGTVDDRSLGAFIAFSVFKGPLNLLSLQVLAL
jgi:hypothetical protein